ncbi:MAG TPA: tRNA (adenosine(37)-N6)-dimethylallyltransferase MiaA [Chitinispirillaceae bacterium]|nr:tRNA (adenosine(37)-N6)-dimethylallyltransferase MiaA [Chitinispirillaceae bacterium]
MKNRYNKNCVVICGPTASGKTHLAVHLSLLFNGEIISADSRQVYRGLNIGSGKDLEEYSTSRGKVDVHLIDIRDPSEVYTLYHFKQDFFTIIDQIRDRNRLPFLAGGTGLYIESILRNFDIPQIPEDVEFRKRYMTKDKADLVEELKRRSPELYERTDLSSKKRVIRALEIVQFSQVEAIVGQQSLPVLKLDPVVLCTRWERSMLYERIDKRLAERIDNGMIDEVKNLLDSGVSSDRLIQLGMEYKHIVHYLKGRVSLEQMITLLKTDIHQLAKRQETWFRGMERRGVPVTWIDQADCETAEKALNKELVMDD